MNATQQLRRTPIDELRAVSGIGDVTPVALQIIKSAATLYLQQSCEGRDSLADPARLADFWRMRIGARQNEAFEVASNSHGTMAVALNLNTTYVASPAPGSRLTATTSSASSSPCSSHGTIRP